MRIRLVNPPADYWKLLGKSPAAMGVDPLEEGSGQKADFIHLFATEPITLEDAFASARSWMDQDGMVWASWPKKSSS